MFRSLLSIVVMAATLLLGVVTAQAAPILEYTLTGNARTDFSSSGGINKQVAWGFTFRSDAPLHHATPSLAFYEGTGCSFSLNGSAWQSPTCGIEQNRSTFTNKDVITFSIHRNAAFGPQDATGPSAITDAFFQVSTPIGFSFSDPEVLLTNLDTVLDPLVFFRTPFGFDGASGGINFTLVSQAVVPTGVPEPGTLALFGFGIVGLGLVCRRKRT